jgi:hypothetical protein
MGGEGTLHPSPRVFKKVEKKCLNLKDDIGLTFALSHLLT